MIDLFFGPHRPQWAVGTWHNCGTGTLAKGPQPTESPKSLLVFGSSSGPPSSQTLMELVTCVVLFAAIHESQSDVWRTALAAAFLSSRPATHSLCSPATRPFTSAPCQSLNLQKLFSLPVQFSFSPWSFASSPCPHNQPPSSKAAARLQRWPKQFASSASSCCLCLKGQRLIPTAYRSACCWSLEHCSGSR